MDNTEVVRTGVKWMTISNITTAVTSLLRLAILTRFLERSDFGIVAVITLFIGLTQTFADLGFASAIMHKQDLTCKQFSSLYWIQFFVFLCIYVVLAAFSKPIAIFYNTPKIVELLPIALLDLLVNGFGKLYGTLLQKNFLFRSMAIRNIVSALSSLILAIVLATAGAGVYSLVLSTLFHTLMLNLWNFVAGQRQMRIKFYVSFEENFSLVKMGLFQTGTQIVDYLASKIDILLIGHLLDIEVLGIYSLAKELLLKLIGLINSIANSVVLPFLSAKQDNDQALNEMYCKVIHYLSFITFPVVAITVILSHPIVEVVYGVKFIDVALLVAILSIWAFGVCIGNPVGNLIVAKGRTDIGFVYALVRVFIMALAVFITVHISIEAVALGQTITTILMFFLSFYLLQYKLTKMKLRNYINSFYRHGLVSLILISISYPLVQNNIIGIRNSVIQLIVYGIIVVSIFLVAVLLFFRCDLNYIIKKK